MYYVIISRQCTNMQQELASALQGRKDIAVILNRRYGERRVDQEPKSPDRRRKDRRRTASLPSLGADS